MKVVLYPGDRLVVEIGDSDGEFQIDYDFEKSGKLTIEADMPDTAGRAGVIYCESFEQDQNSNDVSLVDWRGDDLACPGCHCLPGEGKTEHCNHPEGCGYLGSSLEISLSEDVLIISMKD